MNKLVDGDSALIMVLEEVCVLVETLQAEIFASWFSIESIVSLIIELLVLVELYKLTLSLLGYLKTRICWGGGSIWPPSKSHVWWPNMTNDISLESSCALLLESAKKLQISKMEFFIAKSSYIVKMSKKMKNYTSLKSPWPCHFKYAKNFAKF